MKGSPRAANATAAGSAHTPARFESTIAASQAPLSISASAVFEFGSHACDCKASVEEDVFDAERNHGLVLENEDADGPLVSAGYRLWKVHFVPFSVSSVSAMGAFSFQHNPLSR